MKNKLSYFVALLCVVSSCTTDIDFSNLSTEVGYNTALVIPVGTVHATIDKVLTLVGDDVIKKDTELNTCYLWWNDSIIINTNNINITDFTEGKEIISTFLLIYRGKNFQKISSTFKKLKKFWIKPILV